MGEQRMDVFNGDYPIYDLKLLMDHYFNIPVHA